MALSSTTQFSAIDQACEAGEQFYKVFYENFDKKRTLLGKLYLESATMVWNGNPVSGSAEITKFFDKLPVSEHRVDTLDCQPIPTEVTDNQTSVLVITSGKVKFDGKGNFPFAQNFVLTQTPNGVWKVASSSFRYEE
ncbi:NTF2-related export protein 2-like [Lytechinus variegatus]|uniref:NTF2-related export protein 2-like n=1 Tax=Lytechinus variegatus TaxID=7654 RepID=UPI001BB2C3A0|nr:NTF2-related export protein 2-like [Lytechinus variegatus]